MDFKQILYAKEEGVATITLNRPEVLNAINSEMIEEILSALKDAQENENVRVVVLTGSGRSFSTGADLKKVSGGDESSLYLKGSAVEMRNQGRFGIQKIPRILESLEKPCIASINGFAMGAGFDLASMCDLRIASEGARFSINHLRVGAISLDGGYYFLTRILGVPKTLELVWTWKTFSAQEALQIGYVGLVVPDEDLMMEANKFATRLAKGPPIAMQMAKRLVYGAWDSTLDESLEAAELAWAVLRTSEDAIEGPKAWIDKREPQFRGR